ncbi:MAG: mannitol/fructose-specific phosphotransferase system IIA component (Ntr-type) [Planctomycetota bacterium]|jgi:mannitol/fructose-specific phosphotransferase system IIA component (Ntr-type)
MQLTDLFSSSDFLLSFTPSDKWAAISQMMDHLVQIGKCDASASEALHESVLTRERSMSTGMERGIAIPHAAVDDLTEVVACIGLISGDDGLAFESVDGRPTQIIVLLLIPRAQKLVHIRTLADIARVLGKTSVREALLLAKTGDEALQALAAGEAAVS